MSSMVPAGPPASPGTTPRLVPTPQHRQAAADRSDPSRGPAAGPRPETPGAELVSPFARLTAEATFRLPSVVDESKRGEDGDWFDPCPAAGLDLGLGHTPYDRTLQRWREGVSRDRAKSRFRMARRFLSGSRGVDVSEDALRAHPWHQLTVDDARDVHAAIARHYGTQASRNDLICVLRAVIRECYKLGLLSALRRELLLEELYTIAPGASTRRHRITDKEFDRLMDACLEVGTEFARARNSAIVALFFTTGIRVSELVHLSLADWDRREDSLVLTRTKNNDPHTVYLHPGTKALLLTWLEVRGEAPGRLFPGAGKPLGRAVHPASIRYMLRTRCRAAGIPTFGTHDFRRSFATTLLRRHDAALVSKLLNHRKLTSTLIYDMSSADEMRAAVESINLRPSRDGAA